MKAATTSMFHSVISPASRQRSDRRRSMSSSSRSIRVGRFAIGGRVGIASDDRGLFIPRPTAHCCVSVRLMGELKFGPARVPSQESPEAAVEILLERGYTACEIDFEGRFWMGYDFATRLGELAREHGIALSVHAPIAGFMGHAERGKKLNMAVGVLDPSAGSPKAA